MKLRKLTIYTAIIMGIVFALGIFVKIITKNKNASNKCCEILMPQPAP